MQIFISDQEKRIYLVDKERYNQNEHYKEYVLKSVLPDEDGRVALTESELVERGYEKGEVDVYELEGVIQVSRKEWFETIKDIKVIPNAVLIRLSENGKTINRLYDNDKVIAEWE